MSSQFRAGRRRERMLRKQEKRGVVILNLVSMVDMFTALVFFLLIVTSSVASLRNPRSVALPNSVSTQQPTDSPVLVVTTRSILLQGKPVMSVSDAEHESGEMLAALRTQLLQAPLLPVKDGKPGQTSRGTINIMADRSTPYSLLKKVMVTCGDVQFSRIMLSVNHVPRHES